jgi:hypothetical protein
VEHPSRLRWSPDLIAARTSITDENGREAADSLLQFARQQALAGLGATLRPGDALASVSNTMRLPVS